MRTEFPVTDEAIKALKIKVLRALSAAPYPKEALPYIAQEQHISHEDAYALVEKHGWPDRGAMGRAADVLEGKREPDPEGPKPGPKPKVQPTPILAPEPTLPPSTSMTATGWTPPANGTEQLLQSGEKSSKARTRRLAERVRAELKELAEAVRDERKEAEAARAKAEETARLQAEVAELERQLAEKRAALNPPRVKQSTAERTRRALDAQKVRAWAAENGIDCPDRGRLSTDVVMAYQRAMEGDS